jgi:hypothetical protein
MSVRCLNVAMYVDGVKVDTRHFDVLIPANAVNDRLSPSSDMCVVLDEASARLPGNIHIRDLQSLNYRGLARVVPKLKPGFLRSRANPVAVSSPGGAPLSPQEVQDISQRGGAIFFEQRSYSESGNDGFASVLDSSRALGKAGAKVSPNYRNTTGTLAETAMLRSEGLSQEQVRTALYSCLSKGEVMPALDSLMSSLLSQHGARKVQSIASVKKHPTSGVYQKRVSLTDLPPEDVRNLYAVLAADVMFQITPRQDLVDFFNKYPILQHPIANHANLLKTSMTRSRPDHGYFIPSPGIIAADLSDSLRKSLSSSHNIHLSSLDRLQSRPGTLDHAIGSLAEGYEHIGISDPAGVFAALSVGLYPQDILNLGASGSYKPGTEGLYSDAQVSRARSHALKYNFIPDFRRQEDRRNWDKLTSKTRP